MRMETKSLLFNILEEIRTFNQARFRSSGTPLLLIKLLINVSAPTRHEFDAKTCFQKIATCFENEFISVFNSLLTYATIAAINSLTSENSGVFERVKQTRDHFIAS